MLDLLVSCERQSRGTIAGPISNKKSTFKQWKTGTLKYLFSCLRKLQPLQRENIQNRFLKPKTIRVQRLDRRLVSIEDCASPRQSSVQSFGFCSGCRALRIYSTERSPDCSGG